MGMGTSVVDLTADRRSGARRCEKLAHHLAQFRRQCRITTDTPSLSVPMAITGARRDIPVMRAIRRTTMPYQGERRARGFAAGVFIGTAIVLPVFAASSPELEQWALPLMAVATILLLVGVGIAAIGSANVSASVAPIVLPRRRAHAVPVRHGAG
jgi:hypothetical protein